MPRIVGGEWRERELQTKQKHGGKHKTTRPRRNMSPWHSNSNESVPADEQKATPTGGGRKEFEKTEGEESTLKSNRGE